MKASTKSQDASVEMMECLFSYEFGLLLLASCLQSVVSYVSVRSICRVESCRSVLSSQYQKNDRSNTLRYPVAMLVCIVFVSNTNSEAL